MSEAGLTELLEPAGMLLIDMTAMATPEIGQTLPLRGMTG